MLAKNKISAFIMSVVLIVSGLLGYWLLTDPLYPLSEIFKSWVEVLISAVLFIVLAYVASRSILTDMDEDAFGWKGLIRWTMLGLLAGLLISLIHKYGLSRVQENTMLEFIFEVLLPLMACLLLFWLIFRRNPLSHSGTRSTGGPSIANMRWVLIIGGTLTVAVGFLFLFLFSPGQVKPILLGSGIVMMGLCGILFGAMIHRGRHNGLERRLSVFAMFLSLVAFIVLMAGMVWP